MFIFVLNLPILGPKGWLTRNLTTELYVGPEILECFEQFPSVCSDKNTDQMVPHKHGRFPLLMADMSHSE